MSNLQQRARSILWKRHISGFRLWNRLLYKRDYPSLEREVFGIRFAHPVGLAPVLDRQVDLLDECGDLGFSFTGLIPGKTPLNTVAERLQGRKSSIVTAVELRAEGDSDTQEIIRQFSLLYDFTDLFVVDINWGSGLSSLDYLSDWVELIDELLHLRLCYEKYKPILLRLSPLHTEEQIVRILDYSLLSGLDGIIVPGAQKVHFCVSYTKGRLPVVGSGAITSPEEAVELIRSGASLVEVCQGLPGHTCSTARRLLQAIDKIVTPS